MIELSHLEPFAQGGRRRCYIMPGQPDRCVKVPLPGRSGKEMWQSKSLFKRWRLPDYYDETRREWRGFLQAVRMADVRVWNHIPFYYGFVSTDLGPGLVTQLLRDFDGSIATPLCTRLKSGLDPNLLHALDELKEFVWDVRFGADYLLVYNILAVQLNEHQVRLYINECNKYKVSPFVSGPLSTVIRMRIQKKIDRFDDQLRRFVERHAGADAAAELDSPRSAQKVSR